MPVRADDNNDRGDDNHECEFEYDCPACQYLYHGGTVHDDHLCDSHNYCRTHDYYDCPYHHDHDRAAAPDTYPRGEQPR